MSLRYRITAGIMGLVLTLVLVLSLINVHRILTVTCDDVARRVKNSATQIHDFVLQRVEEKAAGYQPPPTSLAQVNRLWSDILQHDVMFPRVLEQATSSSLLVREIFVCDTSGRVLTASNASHVGGFHKDLPSFNTWQRKQLLPRLFEVFTRAGDFQITVPLRWSEHENTNFTLQFIVPNKMVRDTVLAEVDSLAWGWVFSALVSLGLALLFSYYVLQPLARLTDVVDKLAAGSEVPTLAPYEEPREFAVLQSKLGLLGKQFLGAQQDAALLRTNIEQLLQRMEEALLVFDHSRRVVVAGKPAERLLGLSREEMIGRTPMELFPPDRSLGAALNTAIELRQPLRDFLVIHSPSGRPAMQLLVSLEWPSDAMRSGFLVTLRDAETRHQLASHLDLSARMSAINKLTGGVAHEIKNPLNAIALHMEVLKAKLVDTDWAKLPELEIITRELSRLDRVVRTFLDFTRPVRLDLHEMDVCELVNEVEALVRAEAALRKVEVRLDINAGPCTIRADRDMLKQALLNVVVNGLEAMPAGGVLEIRLKRTLVEVEIEVADHGCGIPVEVQNKIFQLYYTTKDKGSGIGLAATFQTVQMHGGTIDFDSEVDRGTTFHLRFPAAERSARGAA